MRRKLTSTLLAAALTIVAAAGTTMPALAQDAPEEISGDLTFAFWEFGADTATGWAEIAANFNEVYPDVAIELIPLQGDNWGGYLANFGTMIAGGTIPDTAFVATEGLQFLAANDLIMPLDDLAARDHEELADFFADVHPTLVEQLTIDGDLYMVPNSWNDMVIFYSKSRFAEAGLEDPAPGWTRDDFLAAAQALSGDSDGDGKQDQWGFAWDQTSTFASLTPWVYSNGGSLLTDDLCTATLTTPEVIDGVTFMNDMIHTYNVAPAPTDYVQMYELFYAGDLAMFGAGRWPMGTFEDAEFTDFGIAPWPSNSDTSTTEVGIDGFPIFNASENPEAAWAWVKFSTSQTAQERVVDTTSNIPVRRSVAATLAERAPPDGSAEVLYSALDLGAGAKATPAPANFTGFADTVLRNLGLITAGEATPEEGLARAQDELASIVNCP
jgi:ABC-type glycerol-3-phosphate transport system substrate-binding protein